jgi:hypothetical protein
MLMICAHCTPKVPEFSREVFLTLGEVVLWTARLANAFKNDSMLAHTTQRAVRKLPDATVRRRAASGPLFSSETVEII